jgi:hypothetical protein
MKTKIGQPHENVGEIVLITRRDWMLFALSYLLRKWHAFALLTLFVFAQSHWQILSHNAVSSTSPWAGFEFTTSVVMGTDWLSIYIYFSNVTYMLYIPSQNSFVKSPNPISYSTSELYENASERTHDTQNERTNESLDRSHILSNDKRSWFFRSTI